MEIIPFHSEVPDVTQMDKAALLLCRAQLEAEIAALNAKEPRNMNSEAYETWSEAHEELEDLLDDVWDRLDTLPD